MSKVLVNDSTLSSIANAIRSKNSSNDLYKPSQMSSAIEGINTYPILDQVIFNENFSDPSFELLSFELSCSSLNKNYNSVNIDNFISNYARHKSGTNKDGSAISSTLTLTSSMLKEPFTTFKTRFPISSQFEYSGYITDQIINDFNLIELSRNIEENTTRPSKTISLINDISDYSAILIQGMYRANIQSGYNTSMLYVNPQINIEYWGGMKDRNSTYDCYITFDTVNTAVLTGGSAQWGRNCIIYGMV